MWGRGWWGLRRSSCGCMLTKPDRGAVTDTNAHEVINLLCTLDLGVIDTLLLEDLTRTA